MIRKLYVILETGQCIYHLNLLEFNLRRKKSKIRGKFDPNLVSGFFAAILSFANALEGDNDIHKLALKNSNYYFIKREGIHYIFETDLSDCVFTEEDFYHILKEIAVLIEVYIVENNIDNKLCEIIEDSNLSGKIKKLISRYMQRKIIGRFSY